MVQSRWIAWGRGPIKVIAHKRYRKVFETNSKRTAEMQARGIRDDGWLARISRQSDPKYPWAVYYRKREKRRKQK